MFRLSRLLVFLLLAGPLAGCSSLQRYHEFRLQPEPQLAREGISTNCADPDANEEVVTVYFGTENEIRLRFGLRSGFWLWGPPLIPLIPDWHSGPAVLNIGVEKSKDIEFDSINWTVLTPAGSAKTLKVSRLVDVSCGPSADTREKLKATRVDDSNLPAGCVSNSKSSVLFELPTRSMPESLQLVIRDVRLNGQAQPVKTIPFRHSSFWSYSALGAANERLWGRSTSCE